MILIPQEVVERLARSQQHDDGVVVDMVEILAGLPQASAGEEEEEEARQGRGLRLGGAAGCGTPYPGPPYIGGRGGAPQASYGWRLGFLGPQASP